MQREDQRKVANVLQRSVGHAHHRLLDRVAERLGRPLLVTIEELVRKTLDVAGIDPADVGMIEGHGTATLAGDPVELLALFKTYGAAGSEALLGSIKSNIGHTSAAAGVLAMLEPIVADTGNRALVATLDDLGSATFRADLASMRHETQYTRLFRS